MKHTQNIKKIYFPNTIDDENQATYTVGQNCDKIERIYKNWEMAQVWRMQVIKDKKVHCEIKESVCDVYYDTTS